MERRPLAGAIWLVQATRRMDGVRYLRNSTCLALVLFPAILVLPAVGLKLVAVAALGAVTAGWYRSRRHGCSADAALTARRSRCRASRPL